MVQTGEYGTLQSFGAKCLSAYLPGQLWASRPAHPHTSNDLVLCTLPQSLTSAPHVTSLTTAALALCVQLEQEALAGVIGSAPGLLLRSPAELETGCMRVKGLLGRSKHWQRSLGMLQARPRALAYTLSFDSSR